MNRDFIELSEALKDHAIRMRQRADLPTTSDRDKHDLHTYAAGVDFAARIARDYSDGFRVSLGKDNG